MWLMYNSGILTNLCTITNSQKENKKQKFMRGDDRGKRNQAQILPHGSKPLNVQYTC